MASRKGQKPPGPPGHWLWGHLDAFRSDVLSLAAGASREFGDVVRFRLGPLPVILVNEPGLAAEVLQGRHAIYTKETRSTARTRLACGESLLTGVGSRWRIQRRRMQPVFHPRRMPDLQQTMLGAIGEAEDRWDEFAAGGQPVDVASEMMRLTFTIAARCLFGAEIGDEAGRVEKALAVMLEHVYAGLQRIVNPPLWLPVRSNRKFLAARGELDAIVYRIIRERRASGGNDDDLLSVLLAATDEETEERMTDQQLRNEVITLLLAGHETTANALGWAWHLLSLHRGSRGRLVEELDQNLGGGALSHASLAKLPFGNQVLLESLRLFPPVWIIERRASQSDELGGYAVPRGASVVVCPYTLHRHPEYWDDPDAFRPGRFVGGEAPSSAKGAFLPFGLGPRQCIGQHFALFEARLILAALARRFRMDPVPGHEVTPDPGITLRLRGGLLMRIHRR